MRFGKLSERDGATKDQTHDAGTGEVTLAGSSDGTCDGTIIIISRDKVNTTLSVASWPSSAPEASGRTPR